MIKGNISQGVAKKTFLSFSSSSPSADPIYPEKKRQRFFFPRNFSLRDFYPPLTNEGCHAKPRFHAFSEINVIRRFFLSTYVRGVIHRGTSTIFHLIVTCCLLCVYKREREREGEKESQRLSKSFPDRLDSSLLPLENTGVLLVGANTANTPKFVIYAFLASLVCSIDRPKSLFSCLSPSCLELERN